jgi:hypothetical protein
VLVPLIDGYEAVHRDPRTAADAALAALRASRDGSMWLPVFGWYREQGAGLVGAMVRAGRLDEVREFAGSLGERDRDDVLCAVAAALAENGEVPAALSTAVANAEPAQALCAVGRALGVRLGGAALESTARALFDPAIWPQLTGTQRSGLAVEWVRRYVDAGRYDDAEVLAGAIEDTGSAAPALLALAQEYAARSLHGAALRLLGRSVLAGGWDEALPVLAGWDPEAFHRIAATDLLPLFLPDR